MFFDRDVEHAGRGLAVEVFAVSEGLQGAGLAGKPRQHAGFDSGEVGDDEPVASLGMKAVRISCERVSGSGAWRGSKASPLPALRRVRAVARSGMWLRGKFCTWTRRPAKRPVRPAPTYWIRPRTHLAGQAGQSHIPLPFDAYPILFDASGSEALIRPSW